MARKQRRTAESDRRDRVRQTIGKALSRLDRSLLSLILDAVSVLECRPGPDAPLIGCVDPGRRTVWINPQGRPELGEAEWAFAIGHLLLHLGLGHTASRQGRETHLWPMACEHAADNLLYSLKIGKAPHDLAVETAYAGLPEDEIYERLHLDRRARLSPRTYAGPGRPDIVRSPDLACEHSFRYHWRDGPVDWEKLLAEGIRHSVEEAIEDAAECLAPDEARGRKLWRPAENARRWVMAELPLLGALASEVQILADAPLCHRMDISVAAVNAALGEIYFNPGWKLSQAEVTFIYVHELLHVALLHHCPSRRRGRHPEVWNIACDFVINGWLVEMGVGRTPSIGLLYDPRLKGMSAEEVYDLLVQDRRRCKGLRGFRGGLGDIVDDTPGRRIYRSDVGTLDDMVRRCIASGMACPQRGTLPAGLLEEVRSLFSPPVPWDVELGRWMEEFVPALRESRRSYARASRRQSSTPEIPRPARYIPQEWQEACTFGVVMDTSGSMDRELLGRALGAIASYAEARSVPAVRLVLCDAAPYDAGIVLPTELRGRFPIKGRGGTLLQPGVNWLLNRPDFPPQAPVMIITDGYCESEVLVPGPHCFVLPRKQWQEGALELHTEAPIFRVLKAEYLES